MKGFDIQGKKSNWNEHVKKPDPAKIEALRYPHVQQALETKAALNKNQYRPQDEGKPVFMTRIAT